MAVPIGRTLGTILLVDDHSPLLKLVTTILEGANFKVIPTTSAKQAIRLEASFPATIDLLLSDVRIGSMSGLILAKRLQERRPEMRVMLMSGYPCRALLVPHEGWHYIDKPFAATVLVTRIQHVLRERQSQDKAAKAGSSIETYV